MADRAEIEIALKGAQNAVDSLRKIQTTAEDAAHKTTGAFEGIANRIKSSWAAIGASAAAFGIALKKSLDFTSQYAKLEQGIEAAEKQFGVSGDAIIKKLREVSAGTISDSALIEQANKAMALGVTRNLDEMAKLLEYARLRARAMGIDTTFAFESIVTGIGRASPLILDNLGIITTGWAEEAKAAGKAYDAQFILNKVLQQANDALKKTGPLVMTNAERISAMGASVENAKVAIGGALMPVLNDLLPIIRNAIEAFTALPSSVRIAAAGVAILTPAIISLNTALGPVGAAITGLAAIATIGFGTVLKKSKEAAQAAALEWEKATERLGKSIERMMGSYAVDFTKLTVDELKKAQRDISLNMEEAIKAGDTARAKYYEDLRKALIEEMMRRGKELEAAAKQNEAKVTKVETDAAEARRRKIEEIEEWRRAGIIAAGGKHLLELKELEERKNKLLIGATAEQREIIIKSYEAQRAEIIRMMEADAKEQATRKAEAIASWQRAAMRASGQSLNAELLELEERKNELLKGATAEQTKIIIEAYDIQRKAIINKHEEAADAIINKHGEVTSAIKDDLQSINKLFGAIGGEGGALAQAITGYIELGRAAEVSGNQAEMAGNKAEAALNRVVAIIAIVKAAINETVAGLDFFIDVAGDAGNSRAVRVLTAIKDILTAIGTGSPWKIIQAIRDIVMRGREAAKEEDIEAYKAQGMTSEQARKKAEEEGGAAQTAQRKKERTAGGAIAGQAIGSIVAGPIGTVVGAIVGARVAGRRADGGPVTSGQTYLVGERGPELFTPMSGGTITNNSVTNNNRSVTITGPITIRADDPEQFFRQLQSYQRKYGAFA